MYMEKKIYVIRGGYGDEGEILAAFSTPEKAEEFIDLHADVDVSIEECMLDGALPEPTLMCYRVRCDLNGNNGEIVGIGYEQSIAEAFKDTFQVYEQYKYEFVVFAFGKQEALATARHRTIYLNDHWREKYPYLHDKAFYKSKNNHREELYYVLYNFVTGDIVKETPFRTFVRFEGIEDL